MNTYKYLDAFKVIQADLDGQVHYIVGQPVQCYGLSYNARGVCPGVGSHNAQGVCTLGWAVTMLGVCAPWGRQSQCSGVCTLEWAVTMLGVLCTPGWKVTLPALVFTWYSEWSSDLHKII